MYNLPCDFCKIELTDKELKYGKTLLFSMSCGKCYKEHLRQCEALN